MDVTGTLTGGSVTLVVTVLALAGYRTGRLRSPLQVAACGWVTYTCGLATVLVTRGIPVLVSVVGAALLAVAAMPIVMVAYRRDARRGRVSRLPGEDVPTYRSASAAGRVEDGPGLQPRGRNVAVR
jgi:hypothetical protein